MLFLYTPFKIGKVFVLPRNQTKHCVVFVFLVDYLAFLIYIISAPVKNGAKQYLALIGMAIFITDMI